MVTRLLFRLPDFRLLLCHHHSADPLLCVMNDPDGLAGDFILTAHATKIACKIIIIRLIGPVVEMADRDMEEGM